ncbi:MAG: DHH family phosphoesterase [bacterium]|nr:DHH family phosphoesterase [bacterium]
MTPSEFKKLVEKDKTVLIISSRPLDFDCLGSGLIMKKYLESLGKKAQMVFPYEMAQSEKEYYSFLPFFEEVEDKDSREILNRKNFDLLILVDGSNLPQYFDARSDEGNPPDLTVYDKRINIDHHLPRPKELGTIVIRDSEASSTAEIILRDIVPEEFIDEDMATLGYAALVGDTGNFKWNFHPSTLALAAKLLTRGAKALEIVDRFFFSKSKDDLKLTVYAIENIEFDDSLGVSFLFLPYGKIREDNLNSEKVDLLKTVVQMDLAKTVKEYSLTVMLSEKEPGKISLNGWGNNLRNKVNIPELFAKVGGNGGGHFHAAGATMEGEFDKIKQKLMSLLAEQLKK